MLTVFTISTTATSLGYQPAGDDVVSRWEGTRLVLLLQLTFAIRKVVAKPKGHRYQQLSSEAPAFRQCNLTAPWVVLSVVGITYLPLVNEYRFVLFFPSRRLPSSLSRSSAGVTQLFGSCQAPNRARFRPPAPGRAGGDTPLRTR